MDWRNIRFDASVGTDFPVNLCSSRFTDGHELCTLTDRIKLHIQSTKKSLTASLVLDIQKQFKKNRCSLVPIRAN